MMYYVIGLILGFFIGQYIRYIVLKRKTIVIDSNGVKVKDNDYMIMKDGEGNDWYGKVGFNINKVYLPKGCYIFKCNSIGCRLHTSLGIAGRFTVIPKTKENLKKIEWYSSLPFGFFYKKPKNIMRIGNIELRRKKIEEYKEKHGVGSFIIGLGADKIHEDNYGILLQHVQPAIPGTLGAAAVSERIYKVVEVINSTPEPDGSFKTYHINVPPSVKTAKEAVAWSFQKKESEYNPSIET